MLTIELDPISLRRKPNCGTAQEETMAERSEESVAGMMVVGAAAARVKEVM